VTPTEKKTPLMQKTASTMPGKRKPRHTPAAKKARKKESFNPRSKEGQRPSREDRGSYSRNNQSSNRGDRKPYSRENQPSNRDGQKNSSRDGQKSFSGEGRKPYSRNGQKSYSKDGHKPRSRDIQNARAGRDRSRDAAFDNARKNNSSGKTFEKDVVLSRLQSSTDEMESHETFQSMELNPKIVTELAKMGAATPFPIQEATIPAAMRGRDILGRGKTGSGKTIAFGAPLISKLANIGSVPRIPGTPRALVVAPTRELADQINRTIAPIAKSVGFFTATVYGGVPQRKQEIALNRGVDVVIATPGRLEDLIDQRIITLKEVKTVVVDEADHMSELGFIEPLRRILDQCSDSQKLLFSATLDKAVDSIVRSYLNNPFVYEVPGEDEDTSNINHRVLTLEPSERSAVLHRLVQGEGRSIIFVRTRVTAERLSESLTENGVPAARLHGDLNQAQRNRNLERFSKGSARVMVATDVAARGIHVDDVKMVIQLDLPEEYKTYLHRSGRTGRAGRHGEMISLVPTGRERKMRDLLGRAERKAEFVAVDSNSELLAELAGPIAPPPAATSLDFGDSRFDNQSKGKKNLPKRPYRR